MSIDIFSKFNRYIIFFLFAIFLLIPAKTFASSESMDMYGRLDKDVKKINEFINYADNTKDDVNVMISKIAGYSSYFLESSKFYEQFINSTDQKVSIASKQSKVNAGAMADGINQISDALLNQDEGKYNSGITKVNGEIDNYNKTIASLNEGVTDYGPVYIFAVIIFSIISFILLIKAKIKPQYSSEIAKKECEIELFKSSLWPTIGSIVTLVWYKLTPPGGTYYILWGPILIGLFYFTKQCWVYSKEVRPALMVVIEAEKEELMKKQQIKEEENYCPSCGAELTIGAHFCKNCGAKVI